MTDSKTRKAAEALFDDYIASLERNGEFPDYHETARSLRRGFLAGVELGRKQGFRAGREAVCNLSDPSPRWRDFDSIDWDLVEVEDE